MKKKGKSQASFEYIFIYGWATLIILASLGALYSFDLLNFNGFIGDKCTFYGQVECFESQALSDKSTDTGDITLILRNDFGTDLVIHTLDVRDDYFNCTTSTSLPIYWAENDAETINTTCGGSSEDYVVGSRTDSIIDLVYYRDIPLCAVAGPVNPDCLLNATGTLKTTIVES